MSNRREFMKKSTVMFSALPVFAGNEAVSAREIDKSKERLDPGVKLVRDGIKFARENKKQNTPPVLREEIMDNPNAVFIIRTNVKSVKDNDGRFPPENEQFERAGYETVGKIFRKGSVSGGTTYIKPNFVGGFNADERSVNNGISTHPAYVAGFCEALRSIGNRNIVVGANGGARHKNFVESGLSEIMHEHDICFTEGKYDSFHDYEKSEVVWEECPDGVVMKKIPFFTLTKAKDTTFINLAKSRIHQLGLTTLTIKNLQGIMPVGYMHICNSWIRASRNGSNVTWSLENAMKLQPNKKIFNPNYQREIEDLYVKHARMNYKYWDEGGIVRDYYKAGGWDAYKNGSFVPDRRIFWGEQWGQRMMDINSTITPYINLVEGVVGIDGANKLHLNNFITISRNRVSCDSMASWLMGHDPRELPYLRIAAERGLGSNDIEAMKIYEITDRGVEKVSDYRNIPRARMGVWVYSVKGAPLRYF